MPANLDYTDIRFMRGTYEKVSTWKANPGEPIVDLDNYILAIGDGTTLGGIPINAMTSTTISGTADLDNITTLGRYFLEGISNGPNNIDPATKAVLEVVSSAIGGSFIYQKLFIISGAKGGHIYARSSITQGKTWGKWISVSEFTLNRSNTGTSDGDNNLNNYIFMSQVYVQNISNGPDGSAGEDGILITYSPYDGANQIHQILYMVSGSIAGNIYYRFSTTKNKTFTAPGYPWTILDFKSFSVTPTPNYIPRANASGKIDTGWLNTSNSTTSSSTTTLATSAAVKAVADGKANKSHTHTLADISKTSNANIYSNSTSWDNGAITHIFQSTGQPPSSSGKNGDVWFQYI